MAIGKTIHERMTLIASGIPMRRKRLVSMVEMYPMASPQRLSRRHQSLSAGRQACCPRSRTSRSSERARSGQSADTGRVASSTPRSQAEAWSAVWPHISSSGRNRAQTAGRSGRPYSRHRLSGVSCTQGMPQGFP
jgi:hypothetical protein